jgi:DNA-binding MarR family transcriptional regulator
MKFVVSYNENEDLIVFICDISILNKYGKQRLDEQLSALGVDWRELVVMLVIEQMPGITQARLSPFLQTDKANVTKLLQAMEKKELIRRTANQTDQRNKVCFLTLKGKQLTPRLHEALQAWEAVCFRGISTEDKLLYQKIIDAIAQNLISE